MTVKASQLGKIWRMLRGPMLRGPVLREVLVLKLQGKLAQQGQWIWAS
jgi:hypothetical protein